MPHAASRDPIYRRRRYSAELIDGIELAHRIRKCQFTLAYERKGRALSLRDLWDQALSRRSFSDILESPLPR